MPTVSTKQNPVLIVGASLVGLTAALGLSARNVPTIVLERHAAVSDHPRAIGFTPRTMEIYRALGIAGQIPEVAEDYTIKRAQVHSLTGEWFEITSWSDKDTEPHIQREARERYSASRGAAVPQDHVERILEAAALKQGADIRRGHTVGMVEQDENGVTITVVDDQGNDARLRGSYLIAADGSGSRIREQLRIARDGLGHMGILRSVLFRASLDQYTRTGVHQFHIQRPKFKAFLTTYHDGRWVLMFYDDIERDESTLRSAIYEVIGRFDVKVEIITTGRWELAALVAKVFQCDRVFLAGDAAHTLPPNRGGYGANTGVADADNLAWKLAAVLSGYSSPELLDTYDAERRPFALLRHDEIFARSDFKSYCDESQHGRQPLDDSAIEFGQLYRSKGFLGLGHDLPAALTPDEWNGRPGSHIPHFWVKKHESVLDIIGRTWALITISEEWEPVVAAVNQTLSVQVRHVKISADALLDGDHFQRMMGLSNTGASLVRPDGYIAWRTVDMPCEAVDIFHEALRKVAFAARIT
ncbi:FAD binding domain-containing protein [Aspergillus cavernicola]|uniref:FAD binding domain-containing protein n=1 Tax=Aspergillus cavernicola TaxID=176166 RepID=A0ABR4HT88_9EURO